MRDWPELADRFELVYFRDDVRPTDADLDAFEARFALRLPDDYRTFVKTLGAGEIGEVSTSCEMFAPGGPPGDHPSADLAHLNSDRPRSLSVANYVRDVIAHGPAGLDLGDFARRIEGLVFFFLAREGDDQFAWRPTEVTDPETGDMAIYRVQVESRRVERVAATFREFVIDYLLSGRYGRETFADATDVHFDPAKVFYYVQYLYSSPDDGDDE